MASLRASSILRLPNELQLQIINLLLDEVWLHKHDQHPEAIDLILGQDPDTSLPRDALLRVSKAYRDAEATVINLASSCTFYYRLIAPKIHQSIRMRNNAKSGASISALLRSQQSKFVEELHFFGSTDQYLATPGGLRRSDLDRSSVPCDITDTMPTSVKNVLQHLDHFENLHTLSIEFDGYGSELDAGDKWVRLSVLSFMEPEDRKDVAEAEARRPWRALMKETWDAVSYTKPGHIKFLDIRNLIPKEVSIFSNERFFKFLNGIEHFKLNLVGGWCIIWAIGGMDGYRRFVEHLPEFFLDHLAAAKDITLDITYDGPIEAFNGYTVQSPLEPRKSPQLRRLTLTGVFISTDLVQYLIDHREVLEEAVFHECCAFHPADGGLTWAGLLDTWHSSKPSKIQRLVIEPITAPLLDPSEIKNKGLVREDACRIALEGYAARLQQAIDTSRGNTPDGGPVRRIFPYMVLDDHQDVLHDEVANVEQFLLGYDQAAFDRFLTLCEANKSASGNDWRYSGNIVRTISPLPDMKMLLMHLSSNSRR